MRAMIMVGEGPHGREIVEKALVELGWTDSSTYKAKPKPAFVVRGLEREHLEKLEDRLDTAALDLHGYQSHYDAGIHIMTREDSPGPKDWSPAP